jgi:hypothetical protein
MLDDPRERQQQLDLWKDVVARLQRPRKLQRDNNHEPITVPLFFGRRRVGSVRLHLSKLVDEVARHYRIDRDDDAVYRVASVVVDIARGSASSWLSIAVHDMELRRINPAQLVALLGDPIHAPDVLRSQTFALMYWLEADNDAAIRQISTRLAQGLKARKSYREARKKGGRPRIAPPAVEVREQHAETRDAVRRFRHKVMQLANPAAARTRICQQFPDVTTRAARTGVLDRWLPSRRADVPPLETMVNDLLSKEHGLSPHTIRRYARQRV